MEEREEEEEAPAAGTSREAWALEQKVQRKRQRYGQHRHTAGKRGRATWDQWQSAPRRTHLSPPLSPSCIRPSLPPSLPRPLPLCAVRGLLSESQPWSPQQGSDTQTAARFLGSRPQNSVRGA